jgi:hypothetical protein
MHRIRRQSSGDFIRDSTCFVFCRIVQPEAESPSFAIGMLHEEQRPELDQKLLVVDGRKRAAKCKPLWSECESLRSVTLQV